MRALNLGRVYLCLAFLVVLLSAASAPWTPPPPQAATYYVDPVHGSNLNDGLSPTRAWKTPKPLEPVHSVLSVREPKPQQRYPASSPPVPAASFILRESIPPRLRRIALGAERVKDWTPFSLSTWKTPFQWNPVAVWSKDRLTGDIQELQMGLARDFLWPGEYFWDGDNQALYLSDTRENPDAGSKSIFAVVYDPETKDWKNVKLTGWSHSRPTVFKVVLARNPVCLLIDNELYLDWWGTTESCPTCEEGEGTTLYLRALEGNPDKTGRRVTVVMKGGGWSVTSGDFNGDGLADVVTNSIDGEVHVHFGKKYFKPIPDQTLLGPSGEGQFGFQVASAGDVDGDGFDDLLVALGWGDSASSDRNRVCLYKGSSLGFAEMPDMMIEPPTGHPALGFGHSLSSHPGDINGDGFADVLIGAGSSPGYLCIYHGSAKGLQSTPNQIVSFNTKGGVLNPSHIGDVDGDGFGDIAVAPSATNTHSLRVHVYGGSRRGVRPRCMRTLRIPVEAVNSSRVLTVAPASDLNEDGYADLLVGNQWATGQYTNEGKAYLFYGSKSNVFTSRVTFINYTHSENSRFGLSLQAIDDFNHDGYKDILVGCPYSEDGGFGAIYYGSKYGMPRIPSMVLKTNHAFLGWSVAYAGDVLGRSQKSLVLGEETGASFMYHIPTASPAQLDTMCPGVINCTP